MKIDPIDKRKKSYYHADEKHTGYEVRDISWMTLLWIGVLIIVGVVGFIVVLDSYFTIEKESQIYEIVLKPESNEIRELRAQEHEKLNSYKKLDPQANTYQIPIERAMEKLAEEDFQARQK